MRLVGYADLDDSKRDNTINIVATIYYTLHELHPESDPTVLINT